LANENSLQAAVHRMEVLWEATRATVAAASPDEVLALVAKAIDQAGLYKRAVLTLHDEHGNIVAIGYHGIPDELIAAAQRARRLPPEVRQAMTDPANQISQSFFIPSEAGLDFSGEGRRIESEVSPGAPGEWQPNDELFVPIIDASSQSVGYASVDTPHDGLRPSISGVRQLELFVHLVSEALQGFRERERLQKAEARLERLIMQTDDVIFRCNVIDNTIEFINPAAEILSGYSLDELKSHPLDSTMRQFIHPEDLGHVVAGWHDLQSNTADESAGLEYRIRLRNGEIRWVWEKRTITRDDEGHPLAIEGIMRDITERHKLREKLAESERKFRLQAENTSDLVYAHDADGNMFFISPSVRQFLEAPPEEVLTTHFSDWLTDSPINRAAFEAFDAEVRLGRTVPPFVLELRSRTGRIFLMEFHENLIRDEDGEIVGVQGVGRDVTERFRVGEQLKKSEERFRQLVDLLPQTVFELDLTGKLTFANRFGLELFGYTPEDLEAGLRAADLFIPEETDRLQNEIQKRLSGEEVPRWEWKAKRKDGSTFSALAYSSPIMQGGRSVGLRGIVYDLTERKRVEEALADSEEKYRAVLEQSAEAVYLVDVTTKQVLEANAAFERLLGYTREDHRDLRVYDFIAHPAEDIDQKTDEILAHERSFLRERQYRRKDGSLIDVEVSITAISYRGTKVLCLIARDITARKYAEKELKNERDFVHSLLDTANSLILCLDGQARITVFNRECERVTGYTREEVLGQYLPDIFLPEEARHEGFKDFAAWVRQHPADMYEAPFLTKSGEIRTILWSNSTMFAGDSDELTAIAVGQDVTERKIAEEALRLSEERYALATTAAKLGVWEFNYQTDEFYHDPTIKELLGYRDDEIANTREAWFPLIHPEDRDKMQEAGRAHRVGETPEFVCQHRMLHKDGSIRWLLSRGKLVRDEKGVGSRLIGVDTDITELMLVEDALRESEERLRRVIENMPVMMDAFGENGNIVVWNKESERITGYRAEEIVDNPHALEMLYPDTKYREKMMAEWVRRGNDYQDWEWELTTKNGERRFIAWSNFSDRFPIAGWTTWGIGVDITERKHAEEALREGEERFRAIAGATPIPIAISRLSDGKILYANNLLGPTFGYTSEEILDIPSHELYGDDQGRREILATLRRVGRVENFEVRGMRKDGTMFWALLTLHRIIFGGEAAAFGGFIDITERKRFLEALRQSEETARALLNATADSVFLIDRSGTILAINEPAAKTLGYTVDELAGKRLYDIVSPEVAGFRRLRVEEVIRLKQPIHAESERQGNIYDEHIYPLLDSRGEVERLAVFVGDITERVQVMRQLGRKSEELNRANDVLAEMVDELHRKNHRLRHLTSRLQTKNAELQALVATLAHDLRSPLVSIRELAARFRRRYSRLIDEGGQDMARRISVNASMMLRLVESLLDYSRAGEYIKGTMEFELGAMVEDLWEQVTDAVPQREALLRRQASPLTCRLPQAAMERIVSNLLRNAVVYVSDKNTPNVEVDWREVDDHLELTVADNGIGIAAADREKIFDLFYRAAPGFVDGSGVGLAAVKRIVDAMNGTIGVSPHPGGGSVFTVRIPLNAADGSEVT